MPIGSYNPSESVLGTSPTVSIASSGVGIIDGEFSEDCSRVGWFRGSELSFRSGRLDLKNREILEENVFSAVAVNLDNLPREKKHEAVKEVCRDMPSVSQPLKSKTTKAERRALQEAQRAAKAASKVCGWFDCCSVSS